MNRTGDGGKAGDGGEPGSIPVTAPGNRGVGVHGGTGGAAGACYIESGQVWFENSLFTSNSCGMGGQAKRELYNLDGYPGAGGDGGALLNYGSLEILNCTLAMNLAGQGGTSLRSPQWNGPGGNGGAIFNFGQISVVGSVFFQNRTPLHALDSTVDTRDGEGGAISVWAGDNRMQVMLSNCTLSANSAGSGGGIYYYAQVFGLTNVGLKAVSCSIVSNSANFGAGVSFQGNRNQNFFKNCIIAANVVSSNRGDFAGFGAYLSRGNNLIGRDTVGFALPELGDLSGDATNPLDPVIGPLADNGGGTFTHALLPGSPALDRGAEDIAGFDQRGRPRRSGIRPDIGAYEFGVATPQRIIEFKRLASGAFRFVVTNRSDISFSIWASEDVSASSTSWTKLGNAVPAKNDDYEFTDPAALSFPTRFYQVRWE